MQEDEDHDDGKDGQHGGRQDRAPVNAQIADKVFDGDLDGVFLLIRQHQQRQNVIVPAPHKAENGERHGDGRTEREHDASEDLQLVRTVDARGLHERERDGHIVLTVHEDTGGRGDDGKDDAPDVVVQAQRADDGELGHGERLARDERAQQENAEHQVDRVRCTRK